MRADPQDGPSVSIVIVNRNRPDLLRDCLSCLRANTAGHAYEIIVVDNESAPDHLDDIAALTHHHKLITLREDRSFGEANNIGVEQARGTYVVLLNNDCFVQPGWLTPLIRTLERVPLAGAVGPVFRGVDGGLQEAGAFIRPDGWSLQIGKVPPIDPDEISVTRVVDYNSAACLVMRRETFLAVGGFDPIFEPAYFEDADLCFRIRQAGLFVFCCPESTVIHLENTTTREVWEADKINGILTRNHARFVRRWASVIRSEFRRGLPNDNCPPPKPQAESGEPLGKVAILLRDGLSLAPLTRTGLALVSALQGASQLTILSDEVYSRARVAHLCREFGLSAVAVAAQPRAQTQPDPFDLVIEVCEATVPRCLVRGGASVLLLSGPPSRVGDESRDGADGVLSFDSIWCTSPATRARLIANVAQRASDAMALELARRTTVVPAPLASVQARTSQASPPALALFHPAEDKDLLLARMGRLRSILRTFFPVELTTVPYTGTGEDSGEGAGLADSDAPRDPQVETLAWPTPSAVRAAVERASLAWFVAPQSQKTAAAAVPSIVRQVRAAAIAGCIPIIDAAWVDLDPAAFAALRPAPTFLDWNEAISLASALLKRPDALEAIRRRLRDGVAMYSDEAFAADVRQRVAALTAKRSGAHVAAARADSGAGVPFETTNDHLDSAGALADHGALERHQQLPETEA